jgi:hypothetical protein
LVHIFKGVILTIAYISIVYKCPLLVRLSDLALHKVSNVCSLRTPVRFFCLFFDSCFFDSSHIAPRVITYIYIYIYVSSLIFRFGRSRCIQNVDAET